MCVCVCERERERERKVEDGTIKERELKVKKQRNDEHQDKTAEKENDGTHVKTNFQKTKKTIDKQVRHRNNIGYTNSILACKRIDKLKCRR